MKQNGTATKIDIALLKARVDSIKENDLVHLSSDIADVKSDVKEVKESVKDVHEKVDALAAKVAYYAGALFVIMLIVEYAIKASSK